MVFKFLGQIIKKDSLENLILTGRIEERKIRRKQRTICLMHLDELIVDLGQEKIINCQTLLGATTDTTLWRTRITHIL